MSILFNIKDPYYECNENLTIKPSATKSNSHSELGIYPEKDVYIQTTSYESCDNEHISHLSRYRFANDSSWVVNKNIYNLSKVELDLSEILKGGIGRGCTASQLMANGMHAIGHGNGVYNLPFCIERKGGEEFLLISSQNKVCVKEDIKNVIELAAENGFSYINIPIDSDGHASLVSIKLAEKEAVVKFYDSLSPKEFDYADRYTSELVHFIRSLVPENFQIKECHETLHLLYQGGVQSNGCGYYSIYTAALLMDREDLKELSIDSQPAIPLFNSAHDPCIRAELAIRTLLSYGIENAKKEIDLLRFYGKVEHIFQKLGARALNEAIESLRKSNNVFSFKFPVDLKLFIKGETIDVGGIEVNLSNLLIGGIGYGTSASQLLANGMAAIESSDEVYNFPICIEGLLDVPEEYRKMKLISDLNQVIDIATCRSTVEKVILSGHTILNIPLNVDGMLL